MDINDVVNKQCLALLREATKLKNKNINKAISKVREAICLGYDAHDKLANYLFLAGKTNEAFAVHKDRFDKTPFSRGPLMLKCSSFYFRLGDLKNYFYYASGGCYFSITHNGTCLPGAEEMMNEFFKIREPMQWYATNFPQALKKLNKSSVQKEYEEKFMKLFDNLKPSIYKAISLKVDRNELTKKEQKYFSVFSKELFDNYFKEQLYPLIFD